jgi:hypothetical protein
VNNNIGFRCARFSDLIYRMLAGISVLLCKTASEPINPRHYSLPIRQSAVVAESCKLPKGK